MKYVFLLLAILSEVAGTVALEASAQFTKHFLSFLTIVGYGLALYFLGLTLRTMPIGIAYAIWSGVGTVMVAAVGVVFFKQHLDMPSIVGMTLIIMGVLVMNLLSKAVQH